MFTVYVLKDDQGIFYKGMTSDLTRRMREHKSGSTRTTSRMENIVLVYSEVFDNREAARAREIYFKSAAGRRFLKKALRL